MSGFTLNLHIGGLCLMVPDFNGAQRRIHVLLPPCGHDDDEHVPVLMFDPAAEQVGGGQPTHLAKHVKFPGAEFDLIGVANTPLLDPPPPAVANLTQVFGAQVPRPFLDSNTPGQPVNSRVRFGAGTSSVLDCGAGAFWFFPARSDPDEQPTPPSPQLPIRALWTMEVTQDHLDIVFTAINQSGASVNQPPLYPDPVTKTLDLWVLNSPLKQLPNSVPPPNSTSRPGALQRADHFLAYYPLTDRTNETCVPLYHHSAAIPPKCFLHYGAPGLDLTCIGAQADPQP